MPTCILALVSVGKPINLRAFTRARDAYIHALDLHTSMWLLTLSMLCLAGPCRVRVQERRPVSVFSKCRVPYILLSRCTHSHTVNCPQQNDRAQSDLVVYIDTVPSSALMTSYIDTMPSSTLTTSYIDTVPSSALMTSYIDTVPSSTLTTSQGAPPCG